ncbi:MAG: phosphate acetyltransferase [Rhodobacteraceae bacterium]|nr:phosphate acetyltransferase [Paracoccaceae bacterium]
MSVLDAAFMTARARASRVVFPEMSHPRVAEAVDILATRGLCQPLGLADPSEAQVAAIMRNRGCKPAFARKLVQKPLYRAAAMVAAGEADVLVAGADAPTREVIKAAGMAIGLAAGVTTPSSFFLMLFPDGRELVFADCAVNVAPDASALADIARASSASGEALFGTSRVALLSFSTGSSGGGRSVEVVREAALLCGFPGPVQADAALNAKIAGIKGIEPMNANVLIFPSLDAGNIAYKLCQELGAAQALGPFLQGFARPVCDLSRGASVDDIVNATVLSIAMGA